MPQTPKPATKLLSVSEVRKDFYESRQKQLSLQKPVTLEQARAQQLTMKRGR